VFGGILVSWTAPLVNGHAVAYTEVYRSVLNNSNTAVLVDRAGGGSYMDRVEVTADTEYFYWIETVSIHGTRNARLGPASAVAKPRAKQTLDTLEGLIDAGILSQELRADIGGITTNRNDLLKEIQDRYGAESELALALAELQTNVDGVLTYVGEESFQRQTAVSAMAGQITLTAAAVAQAKAAVLEESLARAAQNSAMASKITAVEVELNGNVATGEVGLKAEIDAVTGQVSSMYTAKVKVNGLIGGFGIANDGNEVEAGFDVDRFWIGRDKDGDPNTADGVYPFVVHGNKVYIREAVIREASIDTLMLQGEAVTVPVVASKDWGDARLPGTGEHNYVKVNSAAINMVKDGLAYILVTASHAINGNGNNWPWAFRIDVENSEGYKNVRHVSGRQPESAPVLSKVIALPQGTTRVHVYWAADQRIALGYVEIFMMGVKK
jgi:hypothetical protein